VRNRLSAGRVQSVALRLVVERESKIDDFIPQEYWSISAELRRENDETVYTVKLRRIDNEKLELTKGEEIAPIAIDLEDADYSINSIKRGERKRRSPAPYITSSLQQEASRKLRFTTRRTMTIAQQLYEGIDMGDGEIVGLITYMRTDSTNISTLAQQEARDYVKKIHGEKFLPEKPPIYKTRSKSAQEAHEAIRPTSVARTPKQMKEYLSRDQYRLYQMIWQRFLASQMEAAVFETMQVNVLGKSVLHEYAFRATGSKVKFPGFLVVYEEVIGEFEKREGDDDTKIPENIVEGQRQHMLKVDPKQHFTQPPPRYSEALLVKALEEHGIGRPSTYAPTISTLQNRGYVFREERRLHPSDTGKLVNGLLKDHFPTIVSYGFTAEMEKNLDRIARGDEEWVEVIREFYGPFAEMVEKAEKEMPEIDTEPEYIGKECPTCEEGQLMIRFGRFGKFVSCERFPDCRHTEPYLEKIGINCPDDDGEIVLRRTRKGRVFYGCSNYPECEFTNWKRPIKEACPNCEGMLIIASKHFAQCIKCEEKFPLEEVQVDDQE